MKKYFIVILSIVAFTYSYSQNVFRDLRSMEKRADAHYNSYSYLSAIELYKNMLEKNKYSSSPEVRVKIARSYQRIGNYQDAVFWYKEAIQKKWKLTTADSSRFARLLMSVGKYDEAKIWTPKILSIDEDIVAVTWANTFTSHAKLFRDSFSFTVKPLIYNSPYSDYAPVYYKDGVLFSSDRPSQRLIKQINTQQEAGFAGLYFFKEKDTIQRPPQPVTIDFNSPLHKGPAVIYDKGTKMLITASGNDGKVSHLQLFAGEWNEKEKTWGNFLPLPFNSNYYSVGHPALSLDGKVLYFVSDMPGGVGGTDIYYATWKDEQWSKPKILKGNVNTEGNEMFPYISPSGALYFSSDGHGGLGGLDILKVEEDEKGSQKLVNPGYPINSASDDFGLALEEKEKSGYFCSNRLGGKGKDDLYIVNIKRIELLVKVADELVSTSSLSPQIKLIDKETMEELVPQSPKENDLKKLFTLKPHHVYELTIRQEDYKPYTKEISTIGLTDDQRVELKAILKRKFDYYVNIKLRDEETENLLGKCVLQIFNQERKQIDTILIADKGEADIKLDVESNYLIKAIADGFEGEINIEKQNKKKVSSVRFVTLFLKAAEEKKYLLKIVDSLGMPATNAIDLVLETANSNVKTKLSLDEKGEVLFSARGAYRLYFLNEKFKYDSISPVQLFGGYRVYIEEKK